MKNFILILILFCISGITLAKTQDWKNNRVSQLEKITVGPWDNFSSVITANDSGIYFTRDSNQISNIYYQDLKTSEVSQYIGEKGDAKQAVLNSQADLLAITYFKYDSQGDICLVKIANKLIDCITTKDTVDQTAFWIDANTLGFIRRHSGQLDWELVEYNRLNSTTHILTSGFISAPNASHDGRYILFNQLLNGKSNVHVFDRQTQSLKQLSDFDLSGITGSFTFSQNGKFIYFNRYLNDTNADQKIDGNDHSVVFRVPLNTWFSATHSVFPEQLTSVNNNCKFPSLSNQYLYVTCAFEGSLDIYRLPLSGVVPPDWNLSQVWEAHNVARNYEQRLLLLNTIRYRFSLNDSFMLEKILSNHLEIGELSAARYYIDELIQRYRRANNAQMTEFYSALSELIHVRASKQRVPVNIVTTRFQQVVAGARKNFRKIKNQPNLNLLLDAHLDYELENYASALTSLKKIDFSADLLPLERYMIFELYKQLLLPEQVEVLLGLYPKMFNDQGISNDSRLYYAFSYLKRLNQMDLPIEQRVIHINTQIKHAEDNNVKTLFQTELLSLEIATSNDKKLQKSKFKSIRTLLKNNRKNHLLRKAMHTRAIQNLGQASQFTYMELLSRHWLTVTHISEMEFVNVAEQYSAITTNKAYGVMANAELAKAYAIFYSAIRQTNDLEAHFQFVTLGLTPGLNKEENLKQSYALLKKQDLLGQNDFYISALQLVIKAEAKEKLDVDALDEALSLLANMRTAGLGPAMKDLLMGYIYHRKLRASQDGYVYDKTFFQQAHYHYMMALDLAQDNARIAASVWQNLGWLQFEVRQYGLAADFFQHRLTLPFVQKMDEVSTRWMLARNLFYNNQKSDALVQAETTLTLVEDNKLGDPGPYLEKSAFYAMQAEDYEKALKYYELLFNNHRLTKENKTKSVLAYAYVLMKLNKTSEAIVQFKKLLQLSDSLKDAAQNNQRLIASYPRRFQLLAYGFLAKLANDNKEQINYRQQRINLFKKIEGKVADYAYDEAGRLSFLIKDLHHIAVANEQLQQYKPMAQAIHEALLKAEKWMDETGDDVGPVIYRTLLNYLTLNISHPVAFSVEESKNRERIIKRVFLAFNDHPYRSSFVVYQHVKLQVLQIALIDNSLLIRDQFENLLQDVEFKHLKKESPGDYEEIRILMSNFLNKT